MHLQRVVTDFAADLSFAEASKKIEEHYQITLPPSTIRIISEKHASNMCKYQKTIDTPRLHRKEPKNIIAEVDGGMVPIVEIDCKFQGDKRKTRKTGWREARLSLAREEGAISPIYKATLGTVDDAGDQLADVVALVGKGTKTHVHCIGDGAPWITDQVDRVLGNQASYLIDFYHLCQYLNMASDCLAPDDKINWNRQQQELMKKNQADCVMKKLKDHIDNKQSDHICGAYKCYQYMEKRTHQFDYLQAIENDLPIGSGEVESGHRSIVQKRLKLPGGWWLEKNAENMIAMRTTRANNNWDKYWRIYHATEMMPN